MARSAAAWCPGGRAGTKTGDRYDRGRLDGHQSGSGGHPGVLPGRRSGVGVGVECPAAGGAELLEPLQVGRGMDPDQALGRRRCGRYDQQVGAEVEILHAAHGRPDPGRSLGVPGTAVVDRFEGLDDDQDGHDVAPVVPAAGRVTASGSAPRTSRGPRGRS